MCELRLHYAADLECEWLRNSFWSTDDGISHHGQMGLRALIILVYRKFGIEVLKALDFRFCTAPVVSPLLVDLFTT